MSRRTAMNLGAFLLVFFLLMFWAINNIVTVNAIERPYPIRSEFVQASGVRANAEVAYLGVHYGEVSKVERIPGRVRITMHIDRGKHIPVGSFAHIFRKSAIGEPYIELTPPKGYHGNHGPYMQKNQSIPMSRTAVPLEFSELLRSASRLVSGISPEKTHTLVHELALALNGRTDALRQLTTATDQLTQSLVAHSDALDRLATNNTRITKVVADHRGSLGQSLTNLRALAESLRTSKGDLSTLLDKGPKFMTTTADLVASQKGNLDCVLKNLTDVIDVASTDAHIQGLATQLDVGPRAYGFVWASRDLDPDGVWERVNLLVDTKNPPPQYAPPHDLPPVPAVPACRSTLTARAASAPAVAVPSGRSPAPARVAAGGGGILFLASALVLRRLLRDRP